MEPGLDPLPNTDLHNPASICSPSTSPSLLNSSLLETLSHRDGMERDDGSRDSGDVFPKTGLHGDSQRKPRTSAFPSSLTWDSDSEKETFDEEDLQQFSNPHGLASQSPGSPTCGQDQDRLDSCANETPERPKNIFFEKDMASSQEGRDQGSNKSYREQVMAQCSTQQTEPANAGSVLDQAGLLFSDTKLNAGHRKEVEEAKGFDQKKVEKRSVPERDVYTFPGDSDPESPPPGPWAHCTFIQRRRKKRALLRPFSGLSPWQRSSGASRKTRVTPSRAKERGKKANDDGGVFEFKEEEEEKNQQKKRPQGLCHEIFTCVECTVYFKKRAHLREHMREHGEDSGRKGQRGNEGAGRKRVKKSGFECMECGQQFTDRLVLVDHHRQHQESRRKILEEIGKLNEGGKAAVAQVRRRKPRQSAVKESSTVCGQFVCLKCNYSSDVPQELADHAKTHKTRGRAAVNRTSPRIQQKSRKKGQKRSSGSAASNLAATTSSERYPTRSSGQPVTEQSEPDPLQPSVCEQQVENEADPLPGHSQNQLAPSTQAEPENHPEGVSAQSDSAPPFGPSLQEESRSPQVGLAEECIPKSPSPVADPVSINRKGAARRRNVALKTTRNRRSKRVVRDVMRRTRASSRLSNQLASTDSTDASNTKNSISNTEQVTEQNQKEAVPEPDPEPEPEPEADPKVATKRDPLEAPAAALQLKRSFSASLRGATERLDLAEGQQAQLRLMLPLVLINTISSEVQTSFSYNRVMGEEPAMASDLQLCPPPKASEESKEQGTEETSHENKECSKDTAKGKQVHHVEEEGEEEEGEEEEEEDEHDEIEEDVVNRLLDVLNEEEDEEDEEGVSVKSMGRKCPYCPERFDNGIGLANHIRGHLNRVGVSYNVRHFISPEEVNAIEKKFSYQKKKKKVANFDPATFSVMRCEFCSAGFDTRAGLSSHARAHLRDFGITNWEVTVSPINVLRELFSKRPDLAVPTSPRDSPEELEKEPGEEKEEPVSEDEEKNASPEAVPQTSESPSQPWKKERNDSEPEGGEEKGEVGVVKMPLLDSFPSKAGTNSTFSIQNEASEPGKETENKGSGLLKCEVCSAQFETRRALSSHALSHVHQLGVSENSGEPLDLLYQITKEPASDAQIPVTTLSQPQAPSSPKNPHHASPIRITSPEKEEESEEEAQDIKPPLPLPVLGGIVKVSPSPSSPSPSSSLPSPSFGRSRSPSPSPVLRKAPISSLLPVSSPLRSQEHKNMGRTQTTALSTTPRPFWAPQETDAPLNLTMEADPNKDIICKLCGAWFETRKGLSSHARAHLRHFGVEYSESKGSPIDLLNRLILTDDFKHRANSLLPDSPEDLRVHGSGAGPPSSSTSTSTASKRPLHPGSLLFKTASLGSGVDSKATSSSSSSSSSHSLLGPPSKKMKPSSQHVFRLSGREMMSIPLAEPMKDVGCEFCGELFENRKGLSSHARSHLRQLGITEWSVNGSPIDTLREVIARRGLPCVMPLKPMKSPSSSPGPGPPRTSLQSPSPSGGVLGRLPFPFTHPPNQHQPTARKMPASASATRTSPTVVMVKPKPEQVEVTVTGAGIAGRDDYTPEPLHPSWSSSDNVHPINLVVAQEREPSRDIRCEFCGEFFENRKGLSSHARSHLRHMGITEWSVNGSPIDTLWEIMRKQGTTPASAVLGVKDEPARNGSPAWNGQGHQSPKVSRKSPLSVLHSGSRLHKHGLGAAGLSTTPPAGKFFGMAPLGKRLLGHHSERSTQAQVKSFSLHPQDFSFKGKVSADKHGEGHMDACCELCGFFFENRKALASHARAHLRQFGVTEWCVNGSPIETLSAWMRSRPQMVAEIHRSYLHGGRNAQKKKSSSSLLPSCDSKTMPAVSQKTSAGQWSSLAVSHGRAVGREAMSSTWASPSRVAEGKSGSGSSSRHVSTHHSNSSVPHAQVARSELNVRVPRGIERRPLKHPSHADGGERESCLPKPPRTSTVPALVPKPPSSPLVKLVGKIYSLKCRFCDVEFQGPLSVQEDWIRHLQQHILNLNYNKPAPTTPNTITKSDTAASESQPSASTSTTTATTATTPTSALTQNPTPTPTPAVTPTPTPTPTSTAPPVASPGTPTMAEPSLTPAT